MELGFDVTSLNIVMDSYVWLHHSRVKVTWCDFSSCANMRQKLSRTVYINHKIYEEERSVICMIEMNNLLTLLDSAKKLVVTSPIFLTILVETELYLVRLFFRHSKCPNTFGSHYRIFYKW